MAESAGITGYYYLHENGDLIYKPAAAAEDLIESTFVRAFWPIDTRRRELAWELLVQALAGGANRQRVQELAARWGCNDDDAAVYADRAGALLMRDGASWCAAQLSRFVNVQESPCGFGVTALEAFAELAKVLGYQPGKFATQTFKEMLNG